MRQEPPTLVLPHPYLVRYNIRSVSNNDENVFRLSLAEKPPVSCSLVDDLLEPLHHTSLSFSDPLIDKRSQKLQEAGNTSWACALRSPVSVLTWDKDEKPSLGQLWLVVYALFTLRPELETIQLSLAGENAEHLAGMILAVALALKCKPPANSLETEQSGQTPVGLLLIVSQSTFWQGAGSALGVRALWAPVAHVCPGLPKSLDAFPLAPLQCTFTTGFPQSRIHARHPVRPLKPAPGFIVYSRYIPHLDELFSIVALDYKNEGHLALFHKWQNDSRVSKAWNETDTPEEHQNYLRRAHEDSHMLTLLARFEADFFAYFEVYQAKEDHVGAKYDAEDYDRGRHFLVRNARFRGPHRASVWWASLVQYTFLDEPRTSFVVGEPKATNSAVLGYDFANGFNIEKLIDLPHKRSALVKCSRERFFQLSPFSWDGQAEIADHSYRAARV
ncbi:hypothetical protein ABVK25_010945 [Lepraria finkii]|uniref:Acyltransferase MbtK/IucB-like conserved domain-containing protein n=1 Tax=Lepraria finkii TaxID=1340010 RepID=A0ABR4ATL9_9LECA